MPYVYLIPAGAVGGLKREMMYPYIPNGATYRNESDGFSNPRYDRNTFRNMSQRGHWDDEETNN